MLRLERICKIYPTGEVLKDVSWEIKHGERIGLVGVNGAGKSTQLKIIAGLEEATEGSLITEGDPSIAYLKQEFDVDFSKTVREELFQAFSPCVPPWCAGHFALVHPASASARHGILFHACVTVQHPITICVARLMPVQVVCSLSLGLSATFVSSDGKTTSITNALCSSSLVLPITKWKQLKYLLEPPVNDIPKGIVMDGQCETAP